MQGGFINYGSVKPPENSCTVKLVKATIIISFYININYKYVEN